ncbi:MAG: tetratricopeptide (TPR) repeat protein [Planctomycetota bacterium]|jgi:tetratricopeptide (TPR) repeat protein
MQISTLTTAALLLAGTALASAPTPDILALKDGRIITDRALSQEDDFAVIHYENGEVRVPMRLVETLIVEGEEWQPTTDEEKVMYAEGKVPYEGKWTTIAKRDKAIAKRIKAQVKAVEADLEHSTWGKRGRDESANFMWDYTIPEHVKEGFVSRCESYYQQFCKDWKVKRDKTKGKMHINFYNNANEFRKISGAGGGALAYFLLIGDYDLNLFYDRVDPELTEQVLYHELSHYLQKLINEQFDYPHWPGEGVAEYYGGALWNAKAKKLDIGLIQSGRLAAVKNDISLGQYMALRQTVLVAQFEDYSWGWTLVHFFMNTKHKKGFIKYMKGLANDKKVKRELGGFQLRRVTPETSLEYLKVCLKLDTEEDVDDLEKEWHDYVDTELQLSGVRGLEKAAVNAFRRGKRIRAKRLFGEALDAGSQDAPTHMRYAQLVARTDGSRAVELLRKAVELDPMTAQYHYQLGKLLKRTGDEQEGKEMILLAKEMNPDVDANEIDFSDFEEEAE